MGAGPVASYQVQDVISSRFPGFLDLGRLGGFDRAGCEVVLAGGDLGPDVQERWRRSWNFTWWSLLTRDNPLCGYRRLRAELDVLAAALAMTIDPSHPADSTLGTAALYVSRHPRRPRKPPA